jgi:preprotein translocase subunit SecG
MTPGGSTLPAGRFSFRGPVMTTLLITLLTLTSVVMVLVVLMQRGRGGGLAGAFGQGGANSAFGTKTGDIFTAVTVSLFVLFVLLSVSLTYTFAAGKH